MSRAAFRRVLRNGKCYSTMRSLHIHNANAKKPGIAKNMFFVRVNLVAGDFNGAGWRKKSGVDQPRDSTIQKAFANTNLPTPRGPKPLWRPGGVPGERADVCGVIKPLSTENEWRTRGHGTCEINREVLSVRPTDGSCHHEVLVHLSLVDARLVDKCHSSKPDRRTHSRKRVNPYDHL